MRAQALFEGFLFHDFAKIQLVVMLLLFLPVVDRLPMPTILPKKRDDAPMRVFCIIVVYRLLSINAM